MFIEPWSIIKLEYYLFIADNASPKAIFELLSLLVINELHLVYWNCLYMAQYYR